MRGRWLLTTAIVSLVGLGAPPAAGSAVPVADPAAGIATSWVVTNALAPFTAAAVLPTPGRNPTVPSTVVADGAGVLQAYVGRPAGVFVNRWTATAGWSSPVRVGADPTPWSVRAASSGRLAVLVWTTSALPTTVRVAVRSASGRWGVPSTLPCRPGPDGVTALASPSAVALIGCTGDLRLGWLREANGAWTGVPAAPVSATALAGSTLVALDATAADGSVVGRGWSAATGWTASSLQAGATGRTVAGKVAVDGANVVAAWTSRDCRSCAGSGDQPLVDVATASWSSSAGWSGATTLLSGQPTPDRPDGTTVGDVALAAGGGRAVVAFDAADPYGWTRPDTLIAALRGTDGAWGTPRVLATGHWATWPAVAIAGGMPWVGWIRTVAPTATWPWLRPGIDARVVALGPDGTPTMSRTVSATRPAPGDRMTLAGTPAGLVTTWGRQANLWRTASRRFAVPTVVLPRGTPAETRGIVAAGSGALIVVRPTVSGAAVTSATASFLPPVVRIPPTIRRSPASLRCVPPTVLPKPRVVTVRWTRNGRSIPGERTFVHRLTAADRGALLRCVVGISTPASPSIVVSSAAVRG